MDVCDTCNENVHCALELAVNLACHDLYVFFFIYLLMRGYINKEVLLETKPVVNHHVPNATCMRKKCCYFN